MHAHRVPSHCCSAFHPDALHAIKPRTCARLICAASLFASVRRAGFATGSSGVQVRELPHQDKHHDCGLFALAYAELFCDCTPRTSSTCPARPARPLASCCLTSPACVRRRRGATRSPTPAAEPAGAVGPTAAGGCGAAAARAAGVQPAFCTVPPRLLPALNSSALRMHQNAACSERCHTWPWQCHWHSLKYTHESSVPVTQSIQALEHMQKRKTTCVDGRIWRLML